jgi:hypothetical protein
MSLQSTEKQRIRTTLICGKCGSKAIISENGNNDSMPQRIRALKCLICGNRQEQGAPCRWPFFHKETGNSSEERNTRHKVFDKGSGLDITRAERARRRGKVKLQAAPGAFALPLIV